MRTSITGKLMRSLLIKQKAIMEQHYQSNKTEFLKNQSMICLSFASFLVFNQVRNLQLATLEPHVDVYFPLQNNMEVNYLCTVCEHVWKGYIQLFLYTVLYMEYINVNYVTLWHEYVWLPMLISVL